jgi:ribosomal protein S18 acetylase RimI-like enzyme
MEHEECTDTRYILASETTHFKQIQALIIEYANSLGFDLCFQNFEQEMCNFPEEYASPDGCLVLAVKGGVTVGCVGLRLFAPGICEMKRLYVKPSYRGQKIGRRLAEIVIERAREKGYRYMRLDTVPTMREAINLYRGLGFMEIDPYRHNPVPGTLYMELDLRIDP